MVDSEHGTSRAERSLLILRIVVSLLLMVHGLARVWLGIVDDFGAFLGTSGFPFGVAVAWTVTVIEILGGALLAAGRFVRGLALFFVLQLIAGIVLVHGAEGWFVVGAGRNGMEYSVLLVVVLLGIAWEAGDA